MWIAHRLILSTWLRGRLSLGVIVGAIVATHRRYQGGSVGKQMAFQARDKRFASLIESFADSLDDSSGDADTPRSAPARHTLAS
jgi:hypothetical protein